MYVHTPTNETFFIKKTIMRSVLFVLIILLVYNNNIVVGGREREFEDTLNHLRELGDKPLTTARLKHDDITSDPPIIAKAQVIDHNNNNNKLKNTLRFKEKRKAKRSKPTKKLQEPKVYPEAELMSAFDYPKGDFKNVIKKTHAKEAIIRAKLAKAEQMSQKIGKYRNELKKLRRKSLVAHKKERLQALAKKLKQENADDRKVTKALTRARNQYTTLEKTKLSLESERLSTKQQLQQLLTDVDLNWHS